MTGVMTGEQIDLQVVSHALVPVLVLLRSVLANRLVQALGLERLRCVLRPLPLARARVQAQAVSLAIHFVSLVSCSCLQTLS